MWFFFIFTALMIAYIKAGPVQKRYLQTIKAPSVQYMLLNADGLLFQYSKGWANVEQQIKANPETRYAIFSATKTFTALAILQLQEQGKLQLEDDVTRYLPEYPHLKDIQIKHLLSHQSGIGNPIPLKWIHLASEAPSFQEHDFIHSVILQNQKRKWPPGQHFAYSNINYLILGKVIAKVSCLSYQEYICRNIIQKLPGVDYLSFAIPHQQYATGYQKRGFSSFILGFLIDKKKYTYRANKQYLGFNPNTVNGKAYGGLIADASSLSRYLQQLLKVDTVLLSQQGKRALFQEQLTRDGQRTGMTLGWFTGQTNGNQYVSHAGGGGGFYCEIRLYPELKLASLVLMNRTGFKDERILDKIDADYIPWKGSSL